jgi:hypothetical protein
MMAREMIGEHLRTAFDRRDAKWRHRFYDLVERTPLAQRDPRITVADDGFPYYTLDVPRVGGPAGTVTVDALVELATSRGFGVTVNAPDAEPWTFTCGDLVTRRAFGSFELPRIGIPAVDGPTLRETRRRSESLSIGAAPATLLPSFVRPLLHRYFTQRLGIAEPGVLAMLSEEQHPPEQLVFRLSRADFADDESFALALAGVTWFLPRHVVVSVLPPDVVASLDRAFVPLLA